MITYKNIFLRLIEQDDKDLYFKSGFENPDKKVDYFTGSSGEFSYDQISRFIDKTVFQENRKHFLIFSVEELVGEIVFSNINMVSKSCDFRIALFRERHFNKKYGTNAIEASLKYVATELGMKSILLEVYDFNHRAIHVYESFGFKIIDKSVNEDGMTYFTMKLLID